MREDGLVKFKTKQGDVVSKEKLNLFLNSRYNIILVFLLYLRFSATQETVGRDDDILIEFVLILPRNCKLLDFELLCHFLHCRYIFFLSGNSV